MKNRLTIAVMFGMVFMVGFVTMFTGSLAAVVKAQFGASNALSQFGSSANFLAYFFMGLPCGMILKRKGYRITSLAAGSSTLRPVLKVIGESEEARRRLNEYRQEADVKYSEAESKSKFDAMALWARAGEKVAKLSCLHALSEDPENPSVTVEGVEWAGRLVDHLTRRMLYMTSLYVFDGEFDERVKKFMRILADKHNRASRSVLLKNTHLDAKDFDSLVKTLQQTGQIRSEITPSGGEVFSLV